MLKWTLVALWLLAAQLAQAAALQPYYIYTDQLDTPKVIVNAANQPVWRWDNADPFGATPPDPNPSGLGSFSFNLRFPGQYYDLETNLEYNYYRDYDPQTGRYVESDPIGLAAGQMSTYAYVDGNPISRVDPMGLETSMVCRPIDHWVASLGVKHCFVVVWHWKKDSCGGKKKVIDAQYSVAGGKTPQTDPKAETYSKDRNAFNNPGSNAIDIPISPPPGMSQDAWDQAVRRSGDNYNSGEPYNATGGPNSNTATDNIIENAGGVAPNVPGAWQQNYGEYNFGSGIGH